MVVEPTLDANIVAVTLRQSLQWQTWVFTRPSPSTGYYVSVTKFGVDVNNADRI